MLDFLTLILASAPMLNVENTKESPSASAPDCEATQPPGSSPPSSYRSAFIASTISAIAVIGVPDKSNAVFKSISCITPSIVTLSVPSNIKLKFQVPDDGIVYTPVAPPAGYFVSVPAAVPAVMPVPNPII